MHLSVKAQADYIPLMFRRKTLLVVGAGASCEAGLPSGHQLKTIIAHMLDLSFPGLEPQTGERRIFECLLQVASTSTDSHALERLLMQARRIRDGMPIALSIDNFLDAHQGNDSIELCGKLAITKAVLDAEAGSPMCDKDDRPFDLSSLSRTWYLRLAQLMTEDVQRRDAERAVANLSIITFNYDRCIEHFLRHALITYYQIQPADAEALACKIPIAHPYGQVGNLEWQACDTWVPFGRPDSADLLPTSKQIRTFAERIDDETAVEKIHNMVRNAETIVFLGFAFHRQNLELLTPPDGIAGEFKKVLGTSMGLSQSDIGVINAEVARMLAYRRHDGRFHHDNLETVPLTCSEFLAAYGRTLTN